MIGTPGFCGERLAQAREARGLTATALSEMIGVRKANISQYEHGKQSPSREVMERIVVVLNQPASFFLRPVTLVGEDSIWWRAMSSATKTARGRAHARFIWLTEIVAYLNDYLDFPAVNLPAFQVPSDVQAITLGLIEEIAYECRRFWKLGDGPIADAVLLLENNGIMVSRGELLADKLDAFSHWSDDSERPYIFLGADKESAVRSRHDAAHELGHLILHRQVDRKVIRNPKLFRLIEDQAHRFASAFNLPARGFADQLWTPTLDAFLALKPHWKISIAAMVMRCEQLGILSEEQATRTWINLSRRGWNKEEPLDDRLLPERPRLLRRSIELLVKEGIKTSEQIVSDLAMNASDIESLACLDQGYLTGEASNVVAMPQLKSEIRQPTPRGNSLLTLFPNRRQDG
jgi:Zn-dependent peptidase ImmA (M78 family)/transcriptional regulator with XRE-family HTH domain